MVRKAIWAAAAALVAIVIVALVLDGGHGSRRSGRVAPSGGRPAAAVQDATSAIQAVTIDGTPVLIARPRHPNGRFVLFMHGTDELARVDLRQALTAPLIAALLRAGYGWAEPETGAENWGDPRSVRVDLAAAGYLQAAGNRIIVMAASMGGLDGLQILPKVAPMAFIGLYPVCNLSSVASTPLFQAPVAASHTSIPALSPVPITGPRGLPVLLLASSADTTVPKTANADVCAANALRAGMTVTELSTAGPHGDPSNWRPGPILEFLRRSLPR